MTGLGEKNNYFFFAALATLLWGCGSKQRDQALQRAASPVAKERAAAVRALDGNDEASWLTLVKAARDGAPAVRIEAAAAMARSRREEAPDALAPLLRDPDDAVRIAAARALSQRCGERTEAYLRMAFARSDAQVRSQVIEALRACGKTAEDTLGREEAELRRKAAALLANPAAAQRARGARELGLLCREEDHGPLLALLDDRDGVAAAAAARALGDCGASEAAPRLVALLGEGGEVAAAAAEALLALHAAEAARPQLRKLAVADGDEALSAAVALGRDCETALHARSAKAAAVLAQGCPAKDVERVVAQFLRKGETDVVIPQLALRSQVGGPALVEALRREQAARAKRIAERQPPPEADSAAEIAKAGVPDAPEKERYAQLMARLQERQGAQQARSSASGSRPGDRRSGARRARARGAKGARASSTGPAHGPLERRRSGACGSLLQGFRIGRDAQDAGPCRSGASRTRRLC